MLPEIHVLREFIKPYFKGKPVPEIRWKYEEEILGRALLKDNIIQLNPKMSRYNAGCDVGYGIFYEHNLTLKEGEQYFFVAIHEAGHFVLNYKPPSYYHTLKKDPTLRTITPVEYDIEYRLREAVEDMTGEEATRRELIDVLSFIQDCSVEAHENVEKWAVVEFQKRRKEIQSLLKRAR